MENEKTDVAQVLPQIDFGNNPLQRMEIKDLNVVDSIRSHLKASSLSRKSHNRMRSEFIEAATDLIVFKINQDAAMSKTRVLIDVQELASRQNARLTELVREVVTNSADYLLTFNLSASQGEKEQLDLIDKQLDEGKLTSRRYDKLVSQLEAQVDLNMERMKAVYDQWVEQTLENFHSLASRRPL